MFSRWLNRATLHIALAPRGPILIKSGQETADPTRPGMEFVRTRHSVHGDTVYLPGTSLKGALRSQAERVLRGLGIECCDPFKNSTCRKASHGRRQGKGRPRTPSGAEVFSGQCPACRTFGSLSVAGRCNVEDAYPWSGTSDSREEANATETRFQVGIDRLTGQAQTKALFDLEVVVAGAFYTTIHLDNFSLWQLGLIGALLADMDQGEIPIGFGKSRGLGQVGVEVHRLELETLRGEKAGLLGAGALCRPEQARAYDLTADDAMALPGALRPVATWRGQRIVAEEELAQELLEAVIAGPLGTWVDTKATHGRGR